MTPEEWKEMMDLNNRLMQQAMQDQLEQEINEAIEQQQYELEQEGIIMQNMYDEYEASQGIA